MPQKENPKTKKAAETLGEMLRAFGVNVGEILDDPGVRKKGIEFAESVVDAAAKVAQNKVNSEEARAKFRNVGKAAKTLGSSLDKHFNSNEEME